MGDKEFTAQDGCPYNVDNHINDALDDQENYSVEKTQNGACADLKELGISNKIKSFVTTDTLFFNGKDLTSHDEGSKPRCDREHIPIDDAKNESIDDQKNDYIDDQKNDSIDDQKNDSIDDQKNDYIDDQKNDSVDDQKNDSTDDQKNYSIDDQKNDSIDYQKHGSIDDQKNNSMDRPKNYSNENTQYGQFGDGDDLDDECDSDSLNPLKGCEAKIFMKEDVFLKPHIKMCPRELTYDKTFRTRRPYSCCWRSGEENRIFLGGENIISVLKEDGSEEVFSFWKDTQLISGLAVSLEKQLICSKWGGVFTVNIPESHGYRGESLRPVNTLLVRNPVCAFPINMFQYGVLCITAGGESCIKLFSKKNILTDRAPSSSASLKLHGTLSTKDTACATPDGDICVSNSINFVIHIYSIDGAELRRWRPGAMGFNIRCFLQCCCDGIVLAFDSGGIFWTTQEGPWEGVKGLKAAEVVRLGFMRYCVCSEGKMWIIGNQKVHVYTFNTSPIADSDAP